MTRKEAYDFIKINGLDKEVKNVYGKHYTNLKNEDLFDFAISYKPKEETKNSEEMKEKPEIKKEEKVDNSNIDHIMDVLTSIETWIMNNDDFYNEIDKIFKELDR